jgi:hypothetical protein
VPAVTTRTLVALAVSCSVVAAGCGDGSLSKNDYVKQNNAIQERAMESVSALSSTSDPKELVDELDSAQESLDEAIADLKALDPPADWEDEHDDLVAAIDRMSSIMDDLRAAAKEQDVAALAAASADVSKAQNDAMAAIDAMNADR